MGQVIALSRQRPRSARTGAPAPASAAPVFYFDLASPYTYLVAERVDRRLAYAEWRPARGGRFGTASASATAADAFERAWRAAEQRARDLHLPLVWPDRFPSPVPRAMRVADLAVGSGRGGAFVVAAGRLAFCGGFDLEDPLILAEAAAAAGLDVELALVAARDARRDRAIAASARAVWAEGGATLPALLYGGRLYCGEQRVTTAMLVAPSRAAVHPSAS
jgi:2-hydroxychromene-2-carboxylate isomerase